MRRDNCWRNWTILFWHPNSDVRRLLTDCAAVRHWWTSTTDPIGGGFPTGWRNAAFCPYCSCLSRPHISRSMDRSQWTIAVASTLPWFNALLFLFMGYGEGARVQQENSWYQWLQGQNTDCGINCYREICVRALNGTVARWLLCVKHDGEQVETVL